MTREFPSPPLPDDSTQVLPTLRARCEALGVALDEAQVQSLQAFLAMLIEHSGRVNLTGIRQPAQAERLLLLESIATVIALPALRNSPNNPKSPHLLDIGTGGGIPGIPLAIAYPHLSVTLLEATRKKVDFLRHVIDSLALANVTALWGRAEEHAHEVSLREQFEFVTARGVGGLGTVAELALPFCARGGILAVYKSLPLDSELQAAAYACSELGGSRPRVTSFNLPELPAQHCLVTVEKTARTPKQYPRRAGIPARRPLARP